MMMRFCSNLDTRGLLYWIFRLLRRDSLHTLGCYRDPAYEFDMCRTSAVPALDVTFCDSVVVPQHVGTGHARRSS